MKTVTTKCHRLSLSPESERLDALNSPSGRQSEAIDNKGDIEVTNLRFINYFQTSVGGLLKAKKVTDYEVEPAGLYYRRSRLNGTIERANGAPRGTESLNRFGDADLFLVSKVRVHR